MEHARTSHFPSWCNVRVIQNNFNMLRIKMRVTATESLCAWSVSEGGNAQSLRWMSYSKISGFSWFLVLTWLSNHLYVCLKYIMQMKTVKWKVLIFYDYTLSMSCSFQMNLIDNAGVQFSVILMSKSQSCSLLPAQLSRWCNSAGLYRTSPV